MHNIYWYFFLLFSYGRPTARNDGNPYMPANADVVVSSPLTHSGLRKMPPEKHKLEKKLRIRATTFNSSTDIKPKLTDCIRASDGDHKNLERSNVRNPGNEVPQAKEPEIGKSGVDAMAANQGPAEQ